MYRCNKPYAVEMDDGSIYVGCTSRSPKARFRTHKAGGKTSVGSVRRRGKRLRPDLSRGSQSEAALRARLLRDGYTVRGGRSRPFTGPTRRKRKRGKRRC